MGLFSFFRLVPEEELLLIPLIGAGRGLVRFSSLYKFLAVLKLSFGRLL
jgi:hypothetical protein